MFCEGAKPRGLILSVVLILAACNNQETRARAKFDMDPSLGPSAAPPGATATNWLIPQADLVHLHPGFKVDDLHPECGHSPTANGQDIQLNFIAEATGVPEYHDCQRMITADNAHYGQLIGIYATQQERPANPDSTHYYLLAELLNYGNLTAGSSNDSTYQPLGIKGGASCVYAQLHASPAKALVVSLGDSIDCVQDVISFVPAGAVQLEVRKVVENGAPANAYPRVARWDWDSVHVQQYMGVECGGAWCEIGAPGFVSSVVPPVPPGAPNPQSYVYRIKGWFDVQRLAVKSNGALVPGPTVGVIYPDWQLDLMSKIDFGRPRGVVAAHAIISADDTMYHRKYRLMRERTTMMGVRNPDVNNTGPQQTWDGAVMESNATFPEAHHVLFRPNPSPSLRLRGTVRWRWSEDDEKVWASCVNGCCQIDP